MQEKGENNLTNPHDLLVKATLSHPEAIQEFAKAYFPAAIVERVNLPSLKLTNKSYVTEKLRGYC
ncbi:MAG: Rpn family recombination-promoting nuclease/putative transposase [Candidatus Amoebophilus sp.]